MTKDKILIEIYNNKLFKSYAAKMSPKLVDEVISEVIITVANMNTEKVLDLYYKKDLNRYIITIITNMIINKKSPFNKMYNNADFQIEAAFNFKDITTEDNPFTGEESIELIEDIKSFLNKRDGISLEEKESNDLFDMAFFQSETYQDVADTTDKSKTTIYNSVQDVKEVVVTKFKNRYNDIRNK
tara:strand:- start:198 stop:752 length:555 start_codon:yes stop_codon:yes gene_type:complete